MIIDVSKVSLSVLEQEAKKKLAEYELANYLCSQRKNRVQEVYAEWLEKNEKSVSNKNILRRKLWNQLDVSLSKKQVFRQIDQIAQKNEK